jgi:NRPS condensation-like uncharacterized protein
MTTAPSIIRPLDPGEAFFFMTDKVSCMNFVVIAERQGILALGKIIAALRVVQAENDLLRARILWDQEHGLCFAAGSGAAVPFESGEFQSDEWQDAITAELSRPFADGINPLLRCLYLQSDDAARSVLALCFHHSIADGRAGVELLRRLLELIALDAAALTIRETRPQRTLYESFPARFRWADHPEAAEELMDATMADYKRHGPLTPTPTLAATAETREPHLIQLRFTRAEARRLAMRCREHRTSVHGALCAAQLIAQQRLGAGPANLFLSCPVDMRPHLHPVPPVTPIAFHVSIVSSPFPVAADTDLWQLARDIMDHTRRQLDRGEGHLFFSMYGLEEQPILPDRLKRFTKTVLSSWQNTMVSNVGRIKPVDADPQVERISFALCPMPYQAIFNAASSYGEQLILNLGYDAARLSTELARKIADGMRAQLAAEVG